MVVATLTLAAAALVVPAPTASHCRTAVARGPPRVAQPAMVALKDDLLSLTAGAATTALDDRTRAQVNEIILDLERSSPTPQPAGSNLLNGVWTIQLPGQLGQGLVDSPTRELALALYSTAYAPGTLLQLFNKLPAPLGITLGEISVTIRSPDAGQPRASTEVSVTLPLAGVQPLKFFSNLTPVSDTRLKEEVIEAEVLGRRQLLPGPLARTRTLFVTCARHRTLTPHPQPRVPGVTTACPWRARYLDEDVLITRDDSGVAEVLVRKQDMSWARSSSETSKKGRDEDLTGGVVDEDAPPTSPGGDEPSDME